MSHCDDCAPEFAECWNDGSRCRKQPQKAHSLDRSVRRQLTVADPKRVPTEIAVCPECGGGLWWQVTTSDGVRDMDIDCDNEETADIEDEVYHHWEQGDWEPVLNAVKRWVVAGLSPNGALSCEGRPS